MEKILSIKNLNFSYKNRIVFNELFFDIEENTVNSVIGANNCGKTTLIRLLCGILKSNKSIFYQGNYLSKDNIKEYLLNIGVFFYSNKNRFLFDDVFSEIAFPLENLNYSKKRITKRIDEVLKKFNLYDYKDKNINELSEYEKVKLSLAVSIVHNPKILLLDDIFDTITYFEYYEIIKLLKKQNLTILYTTNKLINVFESDRVILLDHKKVCYDLTAVELLEHDNVLAKMGIDIPVIVDLSLKLEFYNLLDKVIMTPEGLVDALWK